MPFKPLDITGQKYNHLTAISSEGKDKQGRYLWKCECECGNIVIADVSALRRGAKKSCGCKYRVETTKVGVRFGKLVTVSRESEGKWLCKCDCGNERIVGCHLLVGKMARSCGCSKIWSPEKIDDLKGKKFGELTIIKKAGKDRFGRNILWALCSCGKETRVSVSRLNKPGTRSCGCQRNKTWGGYGKIAGVLWRYIKASAISRNLEFDITIEYAWELFLKQNGRCCYSNLELSFVDKMKDCSKASASLDRIDSTKGYIPGNVQWVHKRMQSMKMHYPEDEFIYFCTLVAKHRGNLD